MNSVEHSLNLFYFRYHFNDTLNINIPKELLITILELIMYKWSWWSEKLNYYLYKKRYFNIFFKKNGLETPGYLYKENLINLELVIMCKPGVLRSDWNYISLDMRSVTKRFIAGNIDHIKEFDTLEEAKDEALKMSEQSFGCGSRASYSSIALDLECFGIAKTGEYDGIFYLDDIKEVCIYREGELRNGSNYVHT